jgi:hypothetical protein
MGTRRWSVGSGFAGQDKCQAIVIGMTHGLYDAEHPSNFFVSEDRSLSHGRCAFPNK